VSVDEEVGQSGKVTMSAKYSRYTPGYQTIGGPIDIAAVTKHEEFK
jgi:hypothetical protein